MQTLTEIVAAVVVSSSAAAYSHFGVTLDAEQVEKPTPAQRTVARTAARRITAAPAAKVVIKAAKPPGMTPPLCPAEKARAIKA